MKCKSCAVELNLSQWNESESLKSCPNCSSHHGLEHVYFKYPNEFGNTPRRSTPKHPEGPQSYCSECRADPEIKRNFDEAVLCSDIDKHK